MRAAGVHERRPRGGPLDLPVRRQGRQPPPHRGARLPALGRRTHRRRAVLLRPQAVHPGDAVIFLRPAQPGDALLLATIGAQVFLEAYAPRGVTASLAREVREHFSESVLARELASPQVRFTLAEREGHAVGFSQVCLRRPCPVAAPAPATLELQRLYVLRNTAGQGVGKAMLRHAEQAAAASGQACLWLSAWTGNTRALKFYALQGYADAGA